MKNKIWNKNITAMEKNHPELKRIIDDKKERESEETDVIEIVLESSYTNEPITVVTTEEGKFYLAGKYYPQGMAERISAKYNNLNYGSVVFSVGLSDGRVISKLAEEACEEVTFFIYEPSLSLFLHTMSNYDCSMLLERKGVIWLVGDVGEDNLRDLLSAVLNVDNMLKVKPIIQANYDKIFYEQVKYAIGVLKKSLRKIRVDWNTWVRFSEEMLDNVIKNGKYVYQHYSIDSLFHILPEDVPAIVVAAGPSLDKNITELKKAKGRACILACDTALKPLLNNGIIPDFFFVVDPSKPFELFDNPKVWDIPMIIGMDIPYTIMKNHRGKKFFYKDSYFMLEILEEVFGNDVNKTEHCMSALPTGGSVATSAFSAARLMGAKNVILVGQDLALSGEMEHASGTFAKDRKGTGRKDTELVEDVCGNQVETTKDFKYYLDWYVDEIKRYPDLNVIDATEGGALIHGTIISTLKDALEKHCNNTFSVEEFLKEIPTHFNEEEQRKALEFFHSIPKRFGKIKQQVKEGKKWYNQLEKCASKKELERKEIAKVLKKIKKVNMFVEQETLTDLVMDGIKQDEYLIRATVYNFQDDEQKNLLESAQMGLRLMEKMGETLEKMWPDIEELGNFDGTYGE